MGCSVKSDQKLADHNNHVEHDRPMVQRTAKAALIAALGLIVMACTTTPEPFSAEELDAFAADKRKRAVAEDQEPVTRSIGLYEAMARALKYNLDHRLEMDEVALRYAELTDGEFDMLPAIVARVDWSDRSNVPYSRSVRPDGTVSSVPTSSDDPGNVYSSLELSWDVLDFGLSYYRSKQNADRIMIAEEQRRSTINRVIEDVRTSYWRAVAAERLLEPIDELEKRAERALESAKRQVESGEGDQLEALRFQREMLEALRRAQTLRRDLMVAKNQLAALMNLPQSQHYRVVIPRHVELLTPITRLNSEQMTEMALRNRPEMREIAYRMRINEVEEDAAFLELLPSIRPYAGVSYDSNDLLLNGDWTSWGARVSWDLINVARYPRSKNVIEGQKTLLDARALALTQAIATQVYVSNERFHSLKKETRAARENHLVSDKIFEQAKNEWESGAGSERELVRENLNSILASLRYDATYAEMQGAFANVFASVGLDSFDGRMSGNESVSDLASSLEAIWRKRGDKG